MWKSAVEPRGLEEGCLWPGALGSIRESVWLELSHLPMQAEKKLCSLVQR